MRSINAWSVKQNQWLYFILALLLVKGVFLYFDSFPMFFLGDSQSYIATALENWLPPDRSYFYGYIIQFLSVPTHSLSYLVAFQVIIGAIAAIYVAYLLARYFGVRKNIAFIMGLFCAVEPLQLLYERYVLTEAVSLFVFVLYIYFIFQYLEKPKILTIIVIQVTGVVLISLRLSYLPLVIFFAPVLPLLVLPLLRQRGVVSVLSKGDSAKYKKFASKNAWLLILAIHVVVSTVSTYYLHSAYKGLNGYLYNSYSAYQYRSGFFLLADWSPVLKPEDFPYPECREKVFGNLDYDLTDRNLRGAQRWAEGGIVSNIIGCFPNMAEAEKAAKRTAINALKRAPLEVMALSIHTFEDYWVGEILQQSMKIDRGSDRMLPASLLGSLNKAFVLDASSHPYLKTVTNTYYFAVWPWYLILLLLPLISIIGMVYTDKTLIKYHFVIFISAASLFVVATTLVERPTIRYLQALGWLFFLILGPIIEKILTQRDAMKRHVSV